MIRPAPAPDPAEVALSVPARLLKQRTAEIHRRVEEGLDLIDPALDHARLEVVLERFLGFWSGTEPAVDAWAARHPRLADDLAWTRRRRTERLRRDLDVLAHRLDRPARPVTAAPPVFVEVDTAAVLGWLYVSEGSTLGGAVIDRALRRLSTEEHGAGGYVRLESFTPYEEGPGPMWREYLRLLEQWAGDEPGRCERVAAAGVLAFGSLESWLAPVRREAAA